MLGGLGELLFVDTVTEADWFARNISAQTNEQDYISKSRDALNVWLKVIHQTSRYVGLEDDPLETVYVVDDDPKFGAWVEQTGENAIRVHVTLGTFWALQDIILRALSSENFFNPLNADREYAFRWRGAECRAPVDTFRPETRYWNYACGNYAPDPVLFDIWGQLGMQPPTGDARPWIGRFVKKLPYDGDRLALAPILMHAALSWLILHEESHFRGGHLPYLNDANPGEVDNPFPMEMSRAFEFQADKDATQGLIDMMFSRSWHSGLPPYAQGDWQWLQRFLMSAIGLVIVVMDVGKRREGYGPTHPIPRTRFLATIRHFELFCRNRMLSEGALSTDPAYDDELEQQETIRNYNAQYGALWDLTEIQMMISEEESAQLENSDAMWPLDDAFPSMASGILYWGATNLRNNPEIWTQIVSGAQSLADQASTDFGTTRERCLQFTELAQLWIDDANKLIRQSNEHYRQMTQKFRHWEKGET